MKEEVETVVKWAENVSSYLFFYIFLTKRQNVRGKLISLILN